MSAGEVEAEPVGEVGSGPGSLETSDVGGRGRNPSSGSCVRWKDTLLPLGEKPVHWDVGATESTLLLHQGNIDIYYLRK